MPSSYASQVRIPINAGRFASQYINATIRTSQTVPMRISFGASSLIWSNGGARFEDVFVSTEISDRLGCMNAYDVVLGGRTSFEGYLAIGRGSHLRNVFGSIAVIRNDHIVLNATHDEFISSCVEDSYMAIPLVDERFVGSIESDGQTYNVTFELGLGPSGKMIDVPGEVVSIIRARMASMGAVGLFRLNHRGVREFVMTNCTSAIIAGLPGINIGLANVGAIIISPQDYIFVDDTLEECFLGFHNPSSQRVGRYVALNPLEISGVNTRVSDDLLEICDSAAA